MFTGIIQKIGTVKRVSRGEGLVVSCSYDPSEADGANERP